MADGGISAELILQTILESGNEGLLVVSSDGIICGISSNIAGLFKKKPEELIGVPVVHKKQLFKKVLEVMKTGDSQYGKIEIIKGNRLLVDYLPVIDGELVIGAIARVLLLNNEKNKAESPDFFAEALTDGRNLENILAGAEKIIITKALSICKGNKAKTAKMLNISRPGLYKKMVKLGLE
ncbi:MAG: helix-turn-helix domain-containing protein [Bacillota bacterium]